MGLEPFTTCDSAFFPLYSKVAWMLSGGTFRRHSHVRMRPLKVLLVLQCMSRALCAGLELTLLHTNDVHARVEETNKDSGKCTKGNCFAGVARRFTAVQEIRARDRNVLLLDAGDQFQGTIWFNVYKGKEAAHFMNRLGYNAMVRVLDLVLLLLLALLLLLIIIKPSDIKLLSLPVKVT